MNAIDYVAALAVCMGLGALLGLIPFFVGRAKGRPEYGKWGLLCCAVCGVWGLQIIPAIVFTIIILVSKGDARTTVYRTKNANTAGYQQRTQPVGPVNGPSLCLSCISGEFRGRTYRLDRQGVLIGRDPGCTVRFPDGTPGVSSRHCMVRLDPGGTASLIDLGSTFGTFLSDGRQLPKNYPTPLIPGTRFYLGSTSCMFQIVQG